MGDKKPKTTYKVQAGDSWAKIAKMLYGDERMFAELQRGNANILTLKAGQNIKLVNKVKNPFVSETEAAAAGMMGGTAETGYGFKGTNADILNATSQAVRDNNLQYNPSNRYGMYKLNNAAAGAFTGGNYPGGAGTGGGAGGTKPAGPTSTPAQGFAGPASSEAFYAQQGMNTNAPAGANAPKPIQKPPIGPTAGLPNAATQYAQRASGQQQPAGMPQTSSPTPTADVMYAQQGAGQLNLPGQWAGNQATQKPAMRPNTQAGFVNYETGAINTAPQYVPVKQTTNTASRTPAQPTPYRAQQSAQPQYTGAQNLANNTMNQLDAALAGTGLPPGTIHTSTVRYMGFYGGMTQQQVTDALQKMGYMFDTGSNNWVQPNSNLPGYGVTLPANGPSAPAEFTGLPAIVPPKGYKPFTYVERPGGGGGQPAPVAYAQPAPVMNYTTQNATWNIGR